MINYHSFFESLAQRVVFYIFYIQKGEALQGNPKKPPCRSGPLGNFKSAGGTLSGQLQGGSGRNHPLYQLRTTSHPAASRPTKHRATKADIYHGARQRPSPSGLGGVSGSEPKRPTPLAVRVQGKALVALCLLSVDTERRAPPARRSKR